MNPKDAYDQFISAWPEIQKRIAEPVFTKPVLPGALIEREKCCEECSCYTTQWAEVEVSRGGATRLLCPDCLDTYAEQIADARAFRDAGQQAEDEAQED